MIRPTVVGSHVALVGQLALNRRVKLVGERFFFGAGIMGKV